MRQYSSEKRNDVEYFVGQEKLGLHTYNKQFLGVVGLQSFEDIVTKAIENNCQYVLLGANKSFIPEDGGGEEWYILIEQILVKTQLSVILSVNMADTGLFDYNRLKSHPKFHLQLYITSVGIENFAPDTTLVFEDRLWEQNNRMLYGMQITDAIKSENGVSWQAIATDSILDKKD